MNITIEELLAILSSDNVTVLAGYNGSCERAIGKDKFIYELKKLKQLKEQSAQFGGSRR